MTVVKSADELVDHLDDEGNVVDAVTRRVMREGNLCHRTVFIAVQNLAGELLVHRRADWKDVWPGRWDLAFGGVVAAGEDWHDAAARELAEEAGIREPLDYLGEGRYTDDRVDERGRVYLVHSEGPFTFADGEVVEVAWVRLADLADWVESHEVCPDSVTIVVPRLDAP